MIPAPSIVALLLLLAPVSGCDRPHPDAGAVLEVWAHAGQAAERELLDAQVAEFNALQQGRVHVDITFLPEGAYNGQIQAAALADELPDVLEFDGPYLYNYAWANKLRPLEGLLSDRLFADLLPSLLAQGRYRGTLYAIGSFDSGLGLFARRSALRALGVRIPRSPDEAWDIAEFQSLLQSLAQRDPDGAVLDIKLNYRGEWFSYGFSPVLQSAGADLIERTDGGRARGVLDSEPAIAAMRELQTWFERGYVDPNLDDAAFVSGRVALSWVGHWEFRRYREAWGDDLVVVPLPDFAQGSRTGQGSWQWAITRHTRHPRAAAAFLEYLLEVPRVIETAAANGAVPGRLSAVQALPVYAPGGALHLYVQQLVNGHAVPRPRTPAYPTISSAFARAFHAIRHGADVGASLRRAATAIDAEVADNHGYPALDGSHGR